MNTGRAFRWLAALAVFAALIPGAEADPASIRVEEIETVTIDGAIDIGQGEYITYRITATKKSGQYLLGTSKTPGTTYTKSTGCLTFSASFFSDRGCGKATGVDVTDNLTKGKGAFTARLQQSGLKVKLSFTAVGKGTTSDTPRPAYDVSPSALSADASLGRWFDRFARPKGWFETEGFPRAPISGGAALSRGTIVLANADL